MITQAWHPGDKTNGRAGAVIRPMPAKALGPALVPFVLFLFHPKSLPRRAQRTLDRFLRRRYPGAAIKRNTPFLLKEDIANGLLDAALSSAGFSLSLGFHP